jgi:hypothetical protein
MLGNQEGGSFTRDLYVEEGSETGISLYRGPVENHGGRGEVCSLGTLRDR